MDTLTQDEASPSTPWTVPSAAALDLPGPLLDLLPAAVYVCDRDGFIVRFNRRAVELWGRAPKIDDRSERFCGSYRLFHLDGTPLGHAQCPMVDVLRTGASLRDLEVIMERPDGSRITASVNIDALKDDAGTVVGAVNCFTDITERKRAEERLRASQADLEDFFENSAVAMHWVDADGMIVRANRAELDLLGYARDEYVGRHVSQFHAELGTVSEILTRLGRGETLDKVPATLRAKDGALKQVLISSSVRFRDGKFDHTRCVTLDVTAKVSTEAMLRERERMFREMIDALPAAIYTTDAAGRITYFNEAAVTLSGRRPEIGSDKWCVTWRLYRLDGTPLPHDECPMAIALKEGRPVRGEEAIAERPDGTRIHFAPYPTPLFDESGTVIGAINMLIDVSERRRNDETRQRLAAIVESSDDAIVSKNLDGIITSWNKGAERIFGYTADEIIGKPITTIIPAERRDEEAEISGRIRRGQRVDHFETVRQRKYGSLITVSLTVSPVRDADGRIIGASKIARDVTAQKVAEERIRLLVREVDHRANNLLAIAQAILRLTRAPNLEAYKEAVSGRIGALAKAHKLIGKGPLEGADFRQLLLQELAPYSIGEYNGVVLSGEDFAVSPQTGQGLALIVHELATNSAKYGALSNPAGTVRIEWGATLEGMVRIRWIESGGPKVKVPATRGFGTGLVETVVKNDLGGALSFDWRDQGLAVEFSLYPRG